MNAITNFADTSEIMKGLLERLAPTDMERPTPCADWTVADLVNHIVANTYFFAGAAGSTAQDDTDAITPHDATARYQNAAAAILDAYRSEGTLDRDIETPFGTFPGAMVLSVAFADQLTHCWDLARALNTPVEASDELVSHAQGAWEAFIQQDYRNGEMFRPASAAGPDATSLDRLAAFTGRSV